MKKTRTTFALSVVLYLILKASVMAQTGPWYQQGIFIPENRIELRIINSLDIPRKDVPVVIPRDKMPVTDLHELEITVVDPLLFPREEPDKETLRQFGYHEIRAEKNGRMIFHQLDDLDKDGFWDELFFISDLAPKEERIIYIYLGHNDRGWNAHTTQAYLGSYCRHLIPFWESEYVGWKLWYPTDADVYGKRDPQLISTELGKNNLDGYALPSPMGIDIMRVSKTFGGGGIGLFEYPEFPDSVSRPRFTPTAIKNGRDLAWNAGQLSDTRYAYDVIVNGPLRSMIRIKTFNWDSGAGYYELEQTYSAFTRQNYSVCKVKFNTFKPLNSNTYFAAGIRKHINEQLFYNESGIVVTGGSEKVVNPDDVDGIQQIDIDYIATALLVRSAFNPHFQSVNSYGSNYVFKIKPGSDLSYEYMIAGAWSEGRLFSTLENFRDHMIKTKMEYENPPVIIVGKAETKKEYHHD